MIGAPPEKRGYYNVYDEHTISALNTRHTCVHMHATRVCVWMCYKLLTYFYNGLIQNRIQRGIELLVYVLQDDGISELYSSLQGSHVIVLL